MRAAFILFLFCIFFLGPETNTARQRPRKKQGGRRLPRQRIKNRKYHLCLSDNKKILPRHVCDGIFHCSDLSDEYFCRLPNRMSATEVEAEFKVLENEIFQNNATNPYRDLLQFMQLKKAEYVSESAIDMSNRVCLPGIVRFANRNDVDPCLYCRPGQILCSNDAAGNISEINSMLGTSYTRCVGKQQICDNTVHCVRGEDEAYCRKRGPGINRGRGGGVRLIQQDDESSIVSIEELQSPLKKAKENRNGRRRNTVSNTKLTCKMISEIYSLLQKLEEMGRNIKGKARGSLKLPSKIFGFPSEFVYRRDLGLSSSSLSEKPLESLSQSLEFLKSFPNDSNALRDKNNVIVLNLNQICDGHIECPSKVDELICPGRFYCESGSPLFVNDLAVLDDKADCEDGSDEWPRNQVKSALASKDKMVKDWPLLFMMWVVGVISIVGNGIVITNAMITFCGIRKPKFLSKILTTSSKDESSNRENVSMELKNIRPNRKVVSSPNPGPIGRQRMIKLWNGGLVLNLAFADLLMGVYLISLGSISANQYKRYWSFDKNWRSSVGCQCLGFIVTLSSQASVFSLFALTSLRLFTVVKPITKVWLKLRYLLLICAAIWLLSGVLAVFPILPYVKYYYVTDAWVPFPHYKPPVINKTVADNLIIRLADLRQMSNTSSNISLKSMFWYDMVEYTRSVAPAYADWKFFGYYGSHSVCIPKLFVTIEDVFWQHTAVILGVNFLVVIYICVAYCIIYFKSTSGRSFGHDKNKLPGENTNRKSLFTFPSCLCNFCPGEKQSIKSSPTTISNADEIAHSAEIKSKSNDLQSIQFRIALLIATDCLCWLPICIMGFLKLANFKIGSMAYAVSAVGLLPINSALNPLLYSRFVHVVVKKGWRTLRDRFCTRSRSTSDGA